MSLVLVESASAFTSVLPVASTFVSFLHGSIARYAIPATITCGIVEIGRRYKRKMQQNHQEPGASAPKKRRVQPSESTNLCTEEKVRQLEEQVQHLTNIVHQQNDKLRKMPDWNDVGPILSQVRCLESEVSTRPSRNEVVTLEQMSELSAQVKEKANHAEVVQNMEQVSDLASKVDRKPDRDEVPTLTQVLDLGEKLKQKPNRDEVPNLDQVADLSLEIERKPGFEQVVKPGDAVSQEQFVAALNQKPNFDQVASLAQVRQLQKLVANMEKDNAAHLSEISESVKRKPDMEQVPTLAEVQKLTTDMQERVVPGIMQVGELMSAMKEKPSYNQVCELLDDSCTSNVIQIHDGEWVQTHPRESTEPIIV